MNIQGKQGTATCPANGRSPASTDLSGTGSPSPKAEGGTVSRQDLTPYMRKAVTEDVRTLAELESKWETSPGWGEKGILAEIENPVSELLVFEENRILGFAGCRFLPPEAQITTIVVSPQHTGKGIAKALLGKLLSESSLRGCACAVLEVDETNAPAIMLYKGMGFEIVGRRPKFYNGLRDALLMSKRIKVMSKAPLRRE